MAHSKISVDGIAGPDGLAAVFAALAELGVRAHSGRVGPGRLELDLEPGAPAEAVAVLLRERGLEVVVAEGLHIADQLSPREQELMTLLSEGLQLKEVAQRMGVQTHTAREYWLRVKRKWEVRTIAQAAAIWKEHGEGHDHV